ncbi:MAG: formylglycine-generating enzyme family protein [Pirellulales bacterium]|nr:formylglycine-generating enzyme family protein [Pirellulales bacterium]
MRSRFYIVTSGVLAALLISIAPAEDVIAVGPANGPHPNPLPDHFVVPGEGTCREEASNPLPDHSVVPGEGTRNGEPKKAIRYDLGKGIALDLVLIRPGSFLMGDEKGGPEERPVHQVTISKPFYLGKFEVTQEQWEAVMGKNPGRFRGDKRPVDRVSWDACRAFLKKLNEKFPDSGVTFCLPTEAQWEYACRAGTSTRYSFGDDANKLGDYAWFEDNAGGKTHPVGEKKPNAWGLYDMYGNVWEWCADWYAADYYRHAPAVNPLGPATGSHRILRGGSWSDGAYYCRSSYRYCLPPWFCVYCYGFRVAASITR